MQLEQKPLLFCLLYILFPLQLRKAPAVKSVTDTFDAGGSVPNLEILET